MRVFVDGATGNFIGISLSVGSSSSKQSTSTSRGTTIQAKDIEITATTGNIHATGAKLQADNISLDAAQDVNLLAAVNTNTIQNASESRSVGAGVTLGLGKQSGISFQLNASTSNANARGAETTFDNTLVTATNKLSVKSGGNTNLVGAQLAGNTVKMDVGGDLNVVTLQDKTDFKSEQRSAGFSISVCLPPLCVGGATQLASLTSRDATKANGSLTNTLTLQQAQQLPAEQQRAAENAQIAQLVAPVVFNVVGDIAQENGWNESSPQKIALHAVAGYVVATVSGGNGNTGAIAAAANEATTAKINDIVNAAMPIPDNATPAQVAQTLENRKAVKEAASTGVGIGAVPWRH